MCTRTCVAGSHFRCFRYLQGECRLRLGRTKASLVLLSPCTPFPMTYSPEIIPLAFSMRMSASPQHFSRTHAKSRSSQLGSAFGLHSISDDINSLEIQGKWGSVRQRGSVPSIFNGGTMGDNHFL